MSRAQAMSNSPSQRQGFAHPAAAALWGGLLVSLVVLVVALQQEQTRPEPLPNLSIRKPIPDQPKAKREVVRAAFFDAHVEPQMAATDRLNRQAADRCVQRLRKLMDRYREGVQPFARDMTSISTRLGIVRRMPGDWWKDDGRINLYVQDKFEQNLFSQRSLSRDVSHVLELFREDVNANQYRMLVHVQAALVAADLPEVDLAEYQPFFKSVASQLQSFAADQGKHSVYNGLVVLLISEAGGYAAVSVASGLLVRFGASAALSSAASVGATASTTAVGAGGGSVVGPVGTVVGLGVGLVVGLAIDWWMTDQFEEKLQAQMLVFLNSLESTLLHGKPQSERPQVTSVSASEGGIADLLPAVCDRLHAAYRERFFEQIVLAEASP